MNENGAPVNYLFVIMNTTGSKELQFVLATVALSERLGWAQTIRIS